MDFIRSAYSVDFKFGEGNDTLSRIEWWFPENPTLFFPYPTVMRSLNWWDKEGTPGTVGEQWPGNRKYSKGKTIPQYSYELPCGTPEQFAEGVSSPPPPNPPRNAQGVPDCCLLCQPWFNTRTPQLKGAVFATFTDPDFFLGGAAFWDDPGPLGNWFFFGTENGLSCPPGIEGTILYLDYTGGPSEYFQPCRLAFTSEDKLTGTWVVPPDAPIFAGQAVELRFPPA